MNEFGLRWPQPGKFLLEKYIPRTLIERFNVFEASASHATTCVVLVLLVGVVYTVAPSVIPFEFFEFWRFDTFDMKVFYDSWPLFAWGVGLTALVSFTTRNAPHKNRTAERFLTKGFAISACAGFFEEIVYRWLLFYLAIAMALLINVCTFGLWHLIYETIVGPIANFFTLYKLNHILFNGYGWAVGAAVIASNGSFRDGHKYQGLFGYTNSWFCGMFFFLIMFDHGLPMAIAIHFLYDMFIFIVRYVDAAIERSLGWT
jgi:hypothetical protein